MIINKIFLLVLLQVFRIKSTNVTLEGNTTWNVISRPYFPEPETFAYNQTLELESVIHQCDDDNMFAHSFSPAANISNFHYADIFQINMSKLTPDEIELCTVQNRKVRYWEHFNKDPPEVGPRDEPEEKVKMYQNLDEMN